MLVTFFIAFNLGLFSTLHCVGMCGGILTAMMSAKADTQQNKLNAFNRSLIYNLGRVSSYSIAGLLCGFFGLQIAALFQNFNAHLVLQSIASLVLIALALNILDILPFKNFFESFGMSFWKKIQPLGKNLFPIDSGWRTLLFGMLWGWLPCGLVYSALILSLSTGEPIDGMLTMLFFGLGTLPGMLTTGYFSDYLSQLKSSKNLRIITALLMILIAISLPVSTVYFSSHHDHMSAESTHHH